MDCFSILLVTELTRFAELHKSKHIYRALKRGHTVLLQLFTGLKGPVYSDGRLWFRG